MIRGSETWKMVPEEPPEQMWDGLPRQLVLWQRMTPHTGKVLYEHLRMTGYLIPHWLIQEIPDEDRVPSKGTVAVCIYKAMLENAPAPPVK